MMNAQKTWIQKYLFVFWGLSAACAVNGTAEAADDRTYVYQTVAAATLGEGTESWDDGTTLAQSGKHYVLDVEKIEGATSASISMPTSINTTGAAHQFRGESLTLNSGCSLKFPVTGVDDITFKCKELNLNDGSFLGGGQSILLYYRWRKNECFWQCEDKGGSGKEYTSAIRHCRFWLS